MYSKQDYSQPKEKESTNYTSRYFADEFMQRVNSALSHYALPEKKDYTLRTQENAHLFQDDKRTKERAMGYKANSPYASLLGNDSGKKQQHSLFPLMFSDNYSWN